MRFEQQKLADLAKIDGAVQVFRASLTGPQLAAGVVRDFSEFAIAEHARLFGPRGRRGCWP